MKTEVKFSDIAERALSANWVKYLSMIKGEV